MSWQAGALLVLLGALAAGFVWYERSRPASRIVALVAVLAALGVAGRVLLAPVPNVVATTDIVLLAGYSLGSAPGFAVGALAALVSNFWLGQGPWTLWQMVAWGGIGIAGAVLARLSVRRLGRVGLAVAAGIAGLAYGAFLDLSVMVSFGGEQSLDRYLALSARGLPFNLAHAIGNAALMFAAGPALVAMLARFRERSEVSWVDRDLPAPEPPPAAGRPPPAGSRRSWGAGAAGALIVCLALASAGHPVTADAAVADAARWLERAQNRDGGFGVAPGQASDVAMTGWASLGLEAARRNPLDVGKGPNPVRYLRQNVGALRSTGDLERTVLVLAGAGLDPRALGGRDILEPLEERRRANGSWEGQVNLTAFGILAQRAAGRAASRVRRSANWLRNAQNEDGGWGSRADAESEPDSSGSVLQALAVAPAGAGRAAMQSGAEYLEAAQERDGGWALTPGAGSNSQSTAWAVQGLEAAGNDSGRVRENGNSGLDYLAARQSGNGHYRYSADSDQTPVWVTAQSLLALQRQPFPVAAVAREPSGEAVDPPEEQSPNGGGKKEGGRSAAKPDRGSAKERERDRTASDGKGRNGGKGGKGGKGESREEAASGRAAENGSSGAQRPAARLTPANSETDDTLRRLGLSAIAVLVAGLGAGLFRYRQRLP